MPRMEKVEVSEKHIKLRLVLTAVLILVGVVALSIFVSSLLQKDEGWREIETTTNVPGLSNDFVLQYNLGAAGDATTEYRVLAELYTEYGSTVYALFDCFRTYDDVVNVCAINRSPNEILTLDPVLYEALRTVEESGERYLYLAPIYVEYQSLFMSGEDAFARRRDPRHDPDAAEYVAELIRYCTDEEMVRLEFLDDNRVCLHVAEAYLTLLQTYEIESIIDFAWLRNAFIVDALADAIGAAGFAEGNLSSIDGYMRNLDTTGGEYQFNLFDRVGNTVCNAAILQYRGDIATVNLRAFPIREADMQRMYLYRDGETVTLYVDPDDGWSRYADDALLAYSDTNSCAEIALAIAPVFIADSLDPDALLALGAQDIYAIWCDGTVICNSGSDLTVDQATLFSEDEITYTAKNVGDP